MSYTTLHAIVPLVFAACAGVAWRIGPARVPARLMVAFAVLWIPQSFFRVIEDVGWLWPLVYGIDLWWGVIAGHHRARLPARMARRPRRPVDRGHRARHRRS